MQNFADILIKNSFILDSVYISNIYSLIYDEIKKLNTRKKNAYKDVFKGELFQECAIKNHRDPRLEAFFDKNQRSTHKIMFDELFENNIELKEKFLAKVNDKTKKEIDLLQTSIKETEALAEQFRASLTAILGETNQDACLIHASRSCDQGCCINPQRIDKIKNWTMEEILNNQTHCRKNLY